MTRFVMLAVFLVVTMGESANGDTEHFRPQAARKISILTFSLDDDNSTGPKLRDHEFAQMMKTFQASVDESAITIMIAGCYSGGFIDDLYADVPAKFSVTTSSTWDQLARYHLRNIPPEDQNIPYLLEWSHAVSLGINGPEVAWAQADSLLLQHWSNSIHHVIKDSPEYASRGSLDVDNRWIGSNPLNKFALLVAGDMGNTKNTPPVEIWANWNELLRIYDALQELGFNIRVYANKDGLRPDESAPAFIVLGAATIENVQVGLDNLAADAVGMGPDEFVIWISSDGKLNVKAPAQNPGGGQACSQGSESSFVYSLDLDWEFLLNGADLEVKASGVEDIGGGVGGVEVFVNRTRVGRLQPGTGTTLFAVPEMTYKMGSNYISLVVDQATTPVIDEVGATSGTPNNGLMGGLPKISSLVPEAGIASARQCDRRSLILTFSNDVLVDEEDVSLVDAKDNPISMSFPADIVERMPIVFDQQLPNAEWFILSVSDDIANVLTDEQLDGEVTDSCDSASFPSGNGVEGGSAVVIFGILVGDVNGDLHVTTADTNIINTLIGTGEGDPGWNPQADIDCDLEITQEDFDLAQIHVGDTLGPAPCTLDPAGACCLGDGTCTNVLNSAACATAGGRYRGYGTACASESCDGACCESDGACADGSSNDCTTGTYRGDGTTCASDACTGGCCMSDSTCVSDQTADGCSTAGGGYQGHGTFCEEVNCLKGACCESDASCLEVTENECTTGVYQGDCTLCSEIDCPVTGACCFDDGYCEVMSEDDCTGNNCEPGEYCPHTTFGGAYSGNNTTCVPNDCPDGPPPSGACCLEDGSCLDGLAAPECALQEGDYKGDSSVCADLLCAQPRTYPCCLPDDTCVVNLPIDECYEAGGEVRIFYGDCTPDPCGPVRACCMPNGDCVANQTSAQCVASGGTYQTDESVCTPNPCPVPTGACCMSDDSCQEPQTAAVCEFAGGTYQGHSSTCAGLNCKVNGACCLPADNCVTNCEGACIPATASACAYQGGGYAGDGAKCGSTDCSDCNDGPTVFGTCQTDERTQVVADDADGNAWFGYAVSLSGDMALIGAPNDGVGSRGSAYVMNLGSAACGVAETKLNTSDPESGVLFGEVVAMSGDTAVVADSAVWLGQQEGVAYVFMKPPLGWGTSMVETAKLLLSDPATSVGKTASVAINEGEDIILFGRSIDCEGFCSCEHGEYADGCGSVYVYHRPPLGWGNNTENFNLSASDAGTGGEDFFGHAVSISGHTALVGAPFDEVVGGPNDSGSAYIFRFDGSSWIEEAKLIACDADGGQHFGTSVSISGDVAVVGAPEVVVPGGAAGSAYIFRFDAQAGEWHQEAKLTASDGAVNDQFGYSVSVSGSVAIIGAWSDDEVCPDPSFCNSGSAYVFRFDGLDWNEEARFNASDISSGDQFGISVSISGAAALVGAKVGEAILGVNDSGAAYVFKGLSDCDGAGSLDFCDFINDPSVDCCAPSHNCCETGHGFGCTDADIQNCVCGEPGYGSCCGPVGNWDETCVLAVEWLSCGSCAVGNGIIDACECPWDLDGDGDVAAEDLAILLGNWGPNPGHPADFNFDCVIDAADLAILLGHWGPCGTAAHWEGDPDGFGGLSVLRFAFGGGNGCLSLEEAVQMLGHEDVGAFIEWVLSEVPSDSVYHVALFMLWLLENWPC